MHNSFNTGVITYYIFLVKLQKILCYQCINYAKFCNGKLFKLYRNMVSNKSVNGIYETRSVCGLT